MDFGVDFAKCLKLLDVNWRFVIFLFTFKSIGHLELSLIRWHLASSILRGPGDYEAVSFLRVD